MSFSKALLSVLLRFFWLYKLTPEGIIANIWRTLFFYLTIPKELRERPILYKISNMFLTKTHK